MILLLGVQGQLGGALQRVVPPDTCCWGRRDLDLRQVKEIAPKIIAAQPKIVINTAAMTDVDACEREPAAARAVNGEAPGELARACIKIGAALVHVSTDYVFGRDEARNVPYVESDAPAPVNMYGQSKLQGEEAVQGSGCAYLIIRTCGLYGGEEVKQNYVERVIERARRRQEIRATVDQIYSPTSVGELAPAIWRLIQEQRRGILHAANTAPVSRYAFTRAIVEICGLAVPVVEARRADFGGAARPGYSALDSERIALKDYMSDWKTALANYLS